MVLLEDPIIQVEWVSQLSASTTAENPLHPLCPCGGKWTRWTWRCENQMMTIETNTLKLWRMVILRDIRNVMGLMNFESICGVLRETVCLLGAQRQCQGQSCLPLMCLCWLTPSRPQFAHLN